MDQHGRARRFDALYDAHYDDVRRYAWRRAPSLADDVVAETFLVVWRRMDAVPEESLPWLIGVARNVLLNMRRSERRRGERETRADETPAETAFTDTIGEFSALRCALQILPERDREVLFLAAWEEFDHEAIATIMGCTKTNVALRLFRARKRLDAAMKASTAASVADGVSGPGEIDD